MVTLSTRRISQNLGIGLICFGLLASPALCGPVALQNATATFSQVGGFDISEVIDNNLAGNNGWAIFNAGATNAQTAAFETVVDTGFVTGTLFTFSLQQLFSDNPTHTLGRFRISVTTDNRLLFADGLQSGGDVTANWTVLTPQTALATGGPTLTILGDGSILASGPNPATTLYTVTATTFVTAITGICLEVMEDPSLPTNGPGRFATNGNFVLTEFQVDAIEAPEPATFSLLVGGLAGFGLVLRRRSRLA